MKSVISKMTVLLLASSLAVSSGCASGGSPKANDSSALISGVSDSVTPESQESPAKLNVFSRDIGHIWNGDNEVVKEVEKRLNLDLNYTFTPDTEFLSKVNLLIASNELPDVFIFKNYDFFQYIPQNIFLEISELIKTEGQDILSIYPEMVFDLIRVDGELFGVPGYNEPGKFVFQLRQDWLDSLGLQMPSNLSELRAVLKAFTDGDPDGNGKNDTIGLAPDVQFTDLPIGAPVFQPIFGAYGIMPGYFFEKDGKAYSASIAPEYKEAMEYIKALFMEDKSLDPDTFIMQTDQAKQNYASGRVGAVCGWYSTIPVIAYDQLKMDQNVPEAEWSIIREIRGDNGENGLAANGMLTYTTNITTACANPEAAMRYLNFLATDEGARIAAVGIEGKHHLTQDGQYAGLTEEGQKALDDKWLDVLAFTIQRFDYKKVMYKVNSPHWTPYLDAIAEYPLYYNLFEALSTDESVAYLSELKKIEVEWFIRFVTGAEPLENFGDYSQQWLRAGGREVLDSYISAYNEKNNANLSAGQ
ncbi:MAG: extracellular solute-binding protein [Clostridiales bacterium]|jgi:putative aldouronate transport system substrate-binding protein|nr:extracellular solute-binding protein [Clostridiales bacterium]